MNKYTIQEVLYTRILF